jgi:hypothetical protein
MFHASCSMLHVHEDTHVHVDVHDYEKLIFMYSVQAHIHVYVHVCP